MPKSDKPKPKWVRERLIDRNTFQFKLCLWCGHLQRAEFGMCDKCGAGKIGLGKPYEAWAYLDLKVEAVLTIPNSAAIDALREKLKAT